MIRVADYVMGFLAKKGIDTLYTVTGRGILYLTDALAKEETIQSVSVHHEQAAAYAAYGYAKKSDGIGACLVSTGCASTNAITGVLCAWQDDVPCFFISGQNPLLQTTYHTGANIRTYGSQEANIIRLVEPITKYAVMVEKPEDVAYCMEKAYASAITGRKGPVWIDIPLDIQNMRVEPNELRHFEGITIESESEEEIEKAAKEILDDIEKSERPVFLIGGGVREGDAVDELRNIVDELEIPVVFAPSAVDIYGAGESKGIGSVGSLGGTRAGNITMQNADYLLVLGHRLLSMTTGDQSEKFAREARVVVVNIDEDEQRCCPVKVDKGYALDVKVILSKMMEILKESENPLRNHTAWLEKCLHYKRVFPKCEGNHGGDCPVDIHFLAEKLGEILGEKDVVITDAGFEELIVPAAIGFCGEQRCIHPVSQGAMGFALPAALGACTKSEGDVYVVVGDGSVMMNIQEMQTIVHNQIPIKIVIVNNDCYAVIRKRQKDLFRNRTIGTDASNGVTCPEFESIAKAFGICYYRIENEKDLRDGLRKMKECRETLICEVTCMTDQPYLHSSFGKGISGKMVRRPLEDQSPFLERDVIKREMVIEPIDL